MSGVWLEYRSTRDEKQYRGRCNNILTLIFPPYPLKEELRKTAIAILRSKEGQLNRTTKLTISLASGGGWAARIVKKKFN